jgi:CheY-like chemotaxis protein
MAAQVTDYESPTKNALNSDVLKSSYNKWISTHPNADLHATKVKKILLIEDDLDLAGVLSHNLMKRYACKIDIASDPFEAINQATENFYDLIILDWNLPGLNGGETLSRIEKAMFFEPTLPIQWDGRQVPVVVFSAGLRQECPFRKTKHFNYMCFVSKAQPMDHIIETFAGVINPK